MYVLKMYVTRIFDILYVTFLFVWIQSYSTRTVITYHDVTLILLIAIWRLS